MIVKDEASVVRRCINSVLPIIDYWVIIDTGSTDGTQSIIYDALKGVPGRLEERPWKDFSHNRNEALILARPHADYSLIIDADDELLLQPSFTMPHMEADSYVLQIEDRSVAYRRTQVVRNALPWRYVGVLHEFLTCDHAKTVGHLPFVMRRNHDGARRRDPSTYHNDAGILEQALVGETDPFLVSRYTFYLAQSYRDCGELDKAIDLYLKRAELGFWSEEIYCSLYQAGTLMAAEKGRDTQALAAFQEASAVNPNRAEAYHGASRLLRLRERFEESFQAAAPALLLRPLDGWLFVEPWIYNYGLRDEYSISAYWSGHDLQSLEACVDLLARDDLPEAYRDRIAANARFALRRLSAKPLEKPPDIARKSWVPQSAQGGTEIMVEGLRLHLGSRLKAINLCINYYRIEDVDDRPLVTWIHHNVDQAAVAWMNDPSMAARVAWYVFVSEWQRGRFLDKFGISKEKCIVLRNATDVPPSNRPWSTSSKVKVGYASTPYRGLSVLLDAWDKLKPTNAELHIWSSHQLYGAGHDDTPYIPLYNRAAELAGVTYHGIVPNAELRQAFREIDFLGFPSTFEETSCLTAIEAMAAGCRVICPSLGALPETTGGYARLYPYTSDALSHAEAFAVLLHDELLNPWEGRPERALDQQDAIRVAYDWRVRAADWVAFIDSIQA